MHSSVNAFSSSYLCIVSHLINFWHQPKVWCWTLGWCQKLTRWIPNKGPPVLADPWILSTRGRTQYHTRGQAWSVIGQSSAGLSLIKVQVPKNLVISRQLSILQQNFIITFDMHEHFYHFDWRIKFTDLPQSVNATTSSILHTCFCKAVVFSLVCHDTTTTPAKKIK